jgi:hypothetical protein
MGIRHYQQGDEYAQVAIYNAAAAALPKFKPVTLHEVQRRIRARDFDPTTRFYAEHAGQVVGYSMIQGNGRVSHPWCMPGHEQYAEPLFEAALGSVRQRGVKRAFTAYREDWPAVNAFFRARGFRPAREIVNFLLNFLDMPTPSAGPASAITELRRGDIGDVLALGAGILRDTNPETLRDYLFANPYFPSEALFAVRSGPDAAPRAVGILILDPTYADPRSLDANMPCFRLGAFGTEGMSTKRVRGFFSFLASPGRSLPGLAMDLLGYAAKQLSVSDDLECLAAQVPSDAPALLAFYQQHFQRQGSFPVLERELA